MSKIDTAHEAELALVRFFDHLGNWVIQQPEWPIIMSQPRRVRKRMEQGIAQALSRIPARTFEQPQLGRKLARQLVREMEREDRKWYEGLR